MLSWYLRRFKWYRKHKGGKWYLVMPYDAPYIEMWQREVFRHERVLEEESY